MAKKQLNLFIFLTILLYIVSQTISNLEFNGSETTLFGSGSKTYEIKLTNSFQYFHIKIQSSSNKNPIVSISSTDKECKNNRQLLGMQEYGPINLFLKGKETNNIEYLCIKCHNCKYTIIIKSEEICQLSLGEQYSYLVNEKNQEMDFIFEKSQNENEIKAESIIHFWVKGQNNLSVKQNLEGSIKNYKFDYGEIYSAEYKSNGKYILNINAQLGDYITIGSLIVKDNQSKKLKINDQEILAILTQEKNEICFPIEKKSDLKEGSLLKINGIIYTKTALTYFKHNGNKTNESQKKVENGLIQDFISNSDFNSEDSFCISHLFEEKNNNEIIFSLQLTSNQNTMSFDEYKNFPNFVNNSENLETSENPQLSNRMTAYSFYLNNEQKKDFNSIFTNQDRLNLIEGEIFGQYLLKGEIDLYSINIKNQESLKKVYLDLIIFSGDVDLEIESNFEAHKYFISNKIFYSIQINTSSEEKINFKVTAYKNSYYMVQYQLVKELYQNDNKNFIKSGVNYIQSIIVGDNAALYKDITFKKSEFHAESPFLASFYSQNCKFAVSRTLQNGYIDTINMHDSYGQLIIDENDPYFKSETYTFRVNITEDDISKYNGKLCMLYITGLELPNSNTNSERYISVSDGVPQYYIFTKEYPYMKYSFYVSDVNNALIIHFNLIDKTSYFVEVLLENNLKINKTIYRNDQIIVYSSQLQEKCNVENNVCTININIELENKEDQNQRKLETTIFQYKGSPIYLEKNAVKDDILLGNSEKYYYFDIGKEEMGDITIDYKRGSGYIYAKVVPKENLPYNSEAEWRGIYTFPKNKDESLRYELYLKKIIIDPDDTKNCENGCYVLITVLNNFFRTESFYDETTAFLPYRISITPRIAINDDSSDENDKPIVKIRVNEFIIGNLYPSNEKIYEFYQVNLPFDSEFILIDWQADKSWLYINIGDTRPTKYSYDFRFNSTGYDTLFKITKGQIMKKINSTQDTLRNINLTLGIWTDLLDTLYASVYAFKLSMPPTYKGEEFMNSFEIIHIRSDQKVQCDPFEQEGIYYCIFAVIFDDSDVNGNLVVYPKTQKENVEIHFMGSLVEAEPVEKNDLYYILSEFDNLDDDFSSDNGDTFMYVEKIDKKKCLFFVTYVTELTTIEVLSSTYLLSNGQIFVPNPSTAQIFALQNNSIKFNFETSQDLLINIVSISKGGYFYWETEDEKEMKYYLDGYQDRLTLTSGKGKGKGKNQNQLSYLVCNSTSKIDKYDTNRAGFVFYMTFYPRNGEYNIDELKIGRAIEFNYRQVLFPMNYIAKLKNIDQDIVISITFHNYYLDINEPFKYGKSLYNIWATIIKEEDAINSRYDDFYWPDEDELSIKGSFDGPFSTIFISSEDIQKFNINKEENPYIFFSIGLNEEITASNFNELRLEISILEEKNEDEDLFVNDNVYYNCKLSNDKGISSHIFKYRLRYDPTKPLFLIEFSANSDLVKYAVTIDKNSKTDYEELLYVNKQYLNGRYIMTFEVPNIGENSLYLIVYLDEDKYINPKLTNYVFKYIYGNDINDFYGFSIENDTLEISQTEKNGLKNYTISFYPIDQYNVTYYIKGVYSDSEIKGEKKDTFAISESEGYYVQIFNPANNENTKVSITLENLKQEISYIKVLAKAHFNFLREFVLYKPLNINKDDEEPSSYETIPPSLDLIQIHFNRSLGFYFGYSKNAYKIQKYQLFLGDKNNIPNYIQIKSHSNENLKNRIIYVSTTDKNGKENRIQLVQSSSEKVIKVPIKKEQIEFNYLFVVVECQIKDEERCSYTFEVYGFEYQLFNSFYNYYVSQNNKIMKFMLSEKIEDEENTNTNPVLTVYANGAKQIKLTLTDKSGKEFQAEQFRNVAAITLKTNQLEFYLNVEAEEGDYISIGEKLILDGKSENNVLKPNGNQLFGFLKKTILEKECYLIEDNDNTSPSYIVGLFYNQIAEITFKDKNFEDISSYKKIIKEGYYTYIYGGNQNKDWKYICVGIPDENVYNLDYLAYSLQITKSIYQQGITSLTPLLSGNIYPKIIKKGTYTFFNVALNSKSDEIIYNMLATEGSPRMYIYKCTNFPSCEIDFQTKKDLIYINDLGRMSSWHNTEKYVSSIDGEQYVMVVQCEDFDLSKSDICQFQVSIYGNKDDIYLIEGQQFSQYLLKGQNSRYFIDFSGDKDVDKVFIDIFVVNGDVDINLKNEDGITDIKSQKYYLSNKIFYSVKKKKNNLNFKSIFVNINSNVNSYYIIEYKLIRESGNEDTYDIYNGINYLIPIPKKGNEKIININNLKILNNDIYISNFYSLNCKFNLNKINQNGKEEIASNTNSGQEIITQNANELDSHSYTVSIEEPDLSDFKNNLCMLYVSGLEITNNAFAQREILLSEGIPHKIVFRESFSKIKYIYPNPDKSKNIAINFKVINPAYYTCNIIFNSFNKKEKYFYQSNIEYVDNATITDNCYENNLCSIIVLVQVNSKIENYIPSLEVTIKQIDNIPYYFSKGVIKQDFVAANSWVNLYTTIGEDEKGYVSVDFARGSGLIYAKILPIYGASENNQDWRQYKLPREQEGTLKYDFYNKKLLFKKEDTKFCDDGCYLLISLRSSAIGSFDMQYRFHQFTITVSINPDEDLKENGPIIKIEPEEYVIGSLTDSKKIKKNDMYEFYQLNIPYNAEKIEIDWQSDSAILLLNVGDERPTIESNLIEQKFRSDILFEIPREQITKNLGKDNIDNTLLTIGVYTNIMETEFGTPYSFRVHFSKSKNLNIYKVSSDQKTLCKPTLVDKIETQYNCLFMITYNELDFIYDVMIYSKSQNPSAKTYILGKFIDKDIYDKLDMNKLEELIPNGLTADFNTFADKLDFIFITLSDINSHLFINVLTDKPEDIEFFSSFKTFDTELSPNPSSVQLFSVHNNPFIKLKFKTTKPIFINLASLYGSSKIYLEDEKNIVYNIRNRDDRLSLAIPPYSGKETILIVENLNYNQNYTLFENDSGKPIKKPGVAFYMDYHLRSLDKNLDEIELGKTDEMVYIKSDFPFYYYSKLNDLSHDINVFFNFHNLELKNNNLGKRVIKSNSEELVFKGSIISQNIVYQLRTEKNAKPDNEKSIIGKYDPALLTGQIYLTSDNLKTNIENPTLYLSFEKQQSSNIDYKSVRLELTATVENMDIPVSEKLYQYGKIFNKEDINSYKLKVDNSTGDFRIQFAANSKNINFSINKYKGIKTNSTFKGLETKMERGKLFITFEKSSESDYSEYIYLNVFLNDNVTKLDKSLNNYVFKYINAQSRKNFFEYPILGNSSLEATCKIDKQKKKNIEVKFNRINKDKIDVVYSLKVGKKWEFSKDEIISTIALSESPSYVTQVHNPKDDIINLKMNDIGDDYSYIEVFALIKDGPVIEYVAYDPIYSINISEIENSGNNNKISTLSIVIYCVIAVLVIFIFLVIIIIINNKNKKLLEDVNKISFAQEEKVKVKEENLLLEEDKRIN